MGKHHNTTNAFTRTASNTAHTVSVAQSFHNVPTQSCTHSWACKTNNSSVEHENDKEQC